MSAAKNIVVLTGAGVSAESGVATFRDDDGLWKRFDWRRLATPEAFASEPEAVHEFYNLRRNQMPLVQPNPAHVALARLQREHPGEVTLITQNVDDLHERAGARGVLHMHGELAKARCANCGAVTPCDGDLTCDDVCARCGEVGTMRPNIVWFGEVPFGLEHIAGVLESCDLFAAIGTSGAVWPAAGFAGAAREAGARTVEFNLAESDISAVFAETRRGPAGETVPAWVGEILGG